MKRLIDAISPEKRIYDERKVFFIDDHKELLSKDDIYAIIKDEPPIDAVEVVRCKDCKHRGIVTECPMCYTEDSYDDDYGWEFWDVDKTVDEGFCHCGEKARGDEDADQD